MHAAINGAADDAISVADVYVDVVHCDAFHIDVVRIDAVRPKPPTSEHFLLERRDF